jgi:transcriptional regulator with XRE-family HTH domain
VSIIKDIEHITNQRIAERVRELRSASRQSLDTLARKSGVSRSMISLIERGKCSPTAAVLGKLAAGLDVTVASLFEPPLGGKQKASGPVSRRGAQLQWRDPVSGYCRRNISPSSVTQPMQIVEVEFPPGGRVAFDNASYNVRVYQQVLVLEGSIIITLGKESHRLHKGDCMAMQLDRPIMFRNPTKTPTRYMVVIAPESPAKR